MRKKHSAESKVSTRSYQFPPSGLKSTSVKVLETRCYALLKTFDAISLQKKIPSKIFSIERQLEICATALAQNLKISLKDWLYYQVSESSDQDCFRIPFNYDRGLKLALSKKRNSMSKKYLCKLHGVMKKDPSGNRSEIGKFRRKQNWIGPTGCTFEEAYFFPPPPDEVEEAMLELEKYLHSKGDALWHLAIYFAQFLIIHPFMDGNGRVARALIPQFLFQKRLTQSPLFFISHYFARHRLEYFQRLYAITSQGDWIGWIRFFLKGILEDGKLQIRRRKALIKLYSRTIDLCGIDRKTKSIIEDLFKNPIFSLEKLQSLEGGEAVYRKLKGAKWIAPYQKDRRFIYFKALFKIL